MDTFNRFSARPRTIGRYMVKCPWCKQPFAFESAKAQTAEWYANMGAAGLEHARTCAKFDVAIRADIKPYYHDRDLPEFQDAAKRLKAASNVVYHRCKVQQVTGTLSDKVICGPKCMASKGPTCECSCGGENHGKSWVS